LEETFDGNAPDVHFVFEFPDRRPAVVPGNARTVAGDAD
jgi:hypothetical protein